jgi:hypothetical protein
MNHARRLQYRRLSRAGAAAAAAAGALGLALALVSGGAASPALVLIFVALGCAVNARIWFSRAGRSRVVHARRPRTSSDVNVAAEARRMG